MGSSDRARRGAAALAALAAAGAAGAASLAAAPLFAAGSASDAGLVPAGQRVYAANCASCHGEAGDGAGPAARYLDPLPRDFTRGEFKFRTTPSGSIPTDEDLVRTVRMGVGGTAMPAWGGRLSAGDIRAVVAFVKTFSPRFVEESVDPADVLVIPAAPPPAPEAIATGRVLFRMMKCWECHGLGGRGDGPAAPTLKDGLGRKIKPFDFTGGRYRGGTRAEDVYRTFSTGLDGTPMPAFVEALLLGREAFEDLSAIANAFGPKAVPELEAFGRALPTFEELGALDMAAQRAITDRNRWALVAYVKSLERKRTVLRYLLGDPAGRLDDPLFR